MSQGTQTRVTGALLRRVDPPVVIAFACIVVMLLLGSLYSRSFLSPASRSSSASGVLPQRK